MWKNDYHSFIRQTGWKFIMDSFLKCLQLRLLNLASFFVHIEDTTWPHGDTKFLFECWRIFYVWGHHFCSERRDLLCSHSNSYLFTSEDKVFWRVKISCFGAKAHLVFHWWLYKKYYLFILKTLACRSKNCFETSLAINNGTFAYSLSSSFIQNYGDISPNW